MKRLDVLHILGSAQREGTSISRVVQTLAGALDPERYRTHAWFLGRHGPLVEEMAAAGIPSLALGWETGARDPLGAVRFRRELGRQNFSIVHQHQGARAVRWVVRQASNAAIVVHLHGAVLNPQVALAGADGVIAGSRWIAEQVPGSSCAVVYPGIRVTERVRLAEGSPVIGMAGRLVAGKGIPGLLAAVEELRSAGCVVGLEIAGHGPAGGDVHPFIGWQVDMAAVFRRWSVLAMPSLDEGFGMTALEAMAAGLPVVAFRSGALPELVSDEETGFLVAQTGLTHRLRELVENRELRERMGLAGQERVRRKFTPEEMARKVTAVYEGSMTARGSGADSKRTATRA